jgi:hypothetical protein
MIASILAKGDILPETLRFLGAGWWIVHIIAIPLVGCIGFMIGKKRSGPGKTAGGSGTSPETSQP